SAPASDHSKSKRTIESRAKRSSKIISLGHYSILLASSYTVKSKAYFKSPTHYPCGISTVAAAGKKGRQFTTPCPLFKLIINDSKKTYNTTFATLMYAVMIQDRVSMQKVGCRAGSLPISHKTKSDATASTGGSSASIQFGELMEQELRLKWKAVKRAFEVQAEKDRTLMRLEELRFLATSTKVLDDADAYWIKKQKRLIRNKMRNDLGEEDDEDEYGSF
nr:hypothetical protein [Tanacetum cinerariifolium]